MNVFPISQVIKLRFNVSEVPNLAEIYRSGYIREEQIV